MAVIPRHGFWPHRDFCEDLDLWYRLGTTPGFIRIEAPPVYAYRLHGGSVHHTHRVIYDGMKRVIATELRGGYPGGAERRRERIVSLAAHARHHAMEFSRTHLWRAWDLYLRSFRWNLRLGRIAFLLGFPAISCCRAVAAWTRSRLSEGLRRKGVGTGTSLPVGG